MGDIRNTRRAPGGRGGRRRRTALAVGIAAGVAASLLAPQAHSAPAGGPAQTACPAPLAGKATCYGGQDANGAYYAMAVPRKWNGSLVVHAHGGPDLGAASDPERSQEDLERWSVMVDQGYAWAGSSYRRGGYGTRMAAADTESVRREFVDRFGRPDRTYVHGQSWGGNVAAKVAEIYGAGRDRAYDGALLTNGVLAGGSRGYDYRVDLRAVYQYYCRNLPRPSEPAYPVWQGLPADSDLTSADVRERLRECTGYDAEPDGRTARQQRNLDDILGVTGVPEEALEAHLRFSVFTFRDLVHQRLDGRNPFGNRGVVYRGSHDDRALNAGVERFSPDPTARRDLSWDSDPTGAVRIPVLTLHAIGDPTAYVEHESAYRASLRGAGRERFLVQSFTTERTHSDLSPAEYATSIAALDRWATTGRKPTPRGLAASCPAFDRAYGTGCHYAPHYTPAPYAARVAPRPGGLHWPVLSAAQERALGRIDGIGIAP